MRSRLRSTDDRHEAERARQDEPSAWELWTTRSGECRALLRTLTGVVTVTLTPDTFAILAAQGYGESMVRRAVDALVRAGLAEVRWNVIGMERVPVVSAA